MPVICEVNISPQTCHILQETQTYCDDNVIMTMSTFNLFFSPKWFCVLHLLLLSSFWNEAGKTQTSGCNNTPVQTLHEGGDLKVKTGIGRANRSALELV